MAGTFLADIPPNQISFDNTEIGHFPSPISQLYLALTNYLKHNSITLINRLQSPTNSNSLDDVVSL